MKVFIGKYPRSFSTWKVISVLPLKEQTKDKIWEWFDGGCIDKACDWLNEKHRRKIKIRIDREDTWSMDHTLAHIILPMLKQLKATKQGSPIVDEEDLPVHMRHGTEDDNWIHYKWEWILNEMIFAFENTVDDSWEDSFSHGEPKYEQAEINDEIVGKGFTYIQVNPDYWFDHEGYKRHQERIQNGYRLFGRYYSSLWD